MPSLYQSYLASHPQLKDLLVQKPLPTLDTFPSFRKKLDAWLNALRQDEPVLVFGDYDADGLFSSSIAAEALRLMGFKTEVYIPDRIKDGYGFQAKTVMERGFGRFRHFLVLDSGTNSSVFARTLGNALIVDHHEARPGVALDRDILINPHLDHTGDGDFCTGSLMWLFLQHLASRNQAIAPLLDRALVYATITTLTDMCDLTGHNRRLVQKGLKRLQQNDVDCGLNTLVRMLNPEMNEVTEETIGWSIGPTINAAGRLLQPRVVLDLLASRTLGEAIPFANQLINLNVMRRELTKAYSAEAVEQAKRQPANAPALVVFQPHWHLGIVGLIASHVCHTFQRPAFAFGLHPSGVFWSGSGRAPDGGSVLNLAHQCASHILPGYGGHNGAMGLKVMHPDDLIHALGKIAPGRGTAAPLSDDPISVSVGQITNDELAEFEELRPFGQGNPKPCFHFKGVVTRSQPTKTGNGLLVQFQDITGSMSAYWGEASSPPSNRQIHLFGQFGAPRLGDTRLPLFFARRFS